MEKNRKSLSMGVRGRLLVAFLAICTFSLLAAASGFFSLSQVGGALTRITEQRVPQALSWLELSRLVERVVRAAPTLLGVASEDERAKVSADIAAQAQQLGPLLRQSQAYVSAQDEEAVREVANLVANLNKNLADLDNLVKERLRIAARRDKLSHELVQADSVAVRILAPGVRILDAQIAEWNRRFKNAGTNQKGDDAGSLAGSVVELIPQQKGTAAVDAIQNTLMQISGADSVESIDLLVFPLKRALDSLTQIADSLPDRIKGRMAQQVEIIGRLAIGPESLVQSRKDELAVIDEARQLLDENIRLSTFLTNRVDFLVGGAKKELVNSQLQATAVRSLNTNVLIVVVFMGLASSVLIVWLYVGHNLITRLTALSDSMLAIAGGNLRASLPPPGGSDEIARMADALIVFRDTAVEMEENNLREIATARQRLLDAIENSSEGFAFYDPADELVICNHKYKEFLEPGEEGSIEAGQPFEAIVRRAAENGHIVAARGRVDEWVKERLVRHQIAGEAQLQEHDGGRWLLISERKTSDGGTVAVYSDITELKQREQQLAEKSNALEQLSNQLAKYLSPQLYASIFSGRQEVKIVSQRKRLTVFFSDITSFTQTTDRLQSEDLTKLLNHYLTEMSQIALAYGATIDKYVGDAILIFFGDPETRGVREDAIACVEMALAMRERMHELQNVWLESGIENPLRCRMGINTGLCTVGNFGSETRMDYTIIGSTVNLASRLETACPPGEILISYETHAHVKDAISCEEHGQIAVKGFDYPISTFRVVDLYENLGEAKLPIHARSDHFHLDVDVARMSADEQRDTAAKLRHAADRLSKIAKGA